MALVQLRRILIQTLTGTIQFERAKTPQTSLFLGPRLYNTDEYNFTYNQGFITGRIAGRNLQQQRAFPLPTLSFHLQPGGLTLQLQSHGDPKPLARSRHLGEQALRL
jgi:hypothetical protein